jgi:hypothetical protein
MNYSQQINLEVQIRRMKEKFIEDRNRSNQEFLDLSGKFGNEYLEAFDRFNQKFKDRHKNHKSITFSVSL